MIWIFSIELIKYLFFFHFCVKSGVLLVFPLSRWLQILSNQKKPDFFLWKKNILKKKLNMCWKNLVMVFRKAYIHKSKWWWWRWWDLIQWALCRWGISLHSLHEYKIYKITIIFSCFIFLNFIRVVTLSCFSQQPLTRNIWLFRGLWIHTVLEKNLAKN